MQETILFEKSVAIALGSNLGDRVGLLREAVALLADRGILSDVRVSPYYETAALLMPDSPSDWDRPYINAVLVGRTALEPLKLLGLLQGIENELGRDRSAGKWSPRTLDLDLLLYGNAPDDWLILKDPQLELPHPRMLERSFVMAPLAQLEPDWCHPVSGEPLHWLAMQLPKLEALRAGVLWPQCVGVLNITPDSFSDGGQFLNPDAAFAQALKLCNEGASVIELGAMSTHPKARVLTSYREEWERLGPVLDAVYGALRNHRDCPKISLEIAFAQTAQLALERYKIDILSDFRPALNKELAKLAAQAQCTYLCTHTLSIPSSVQIACLPAKCDPVGIVGQWGTERLEQLRALGIKSIILDPGLGMGKTPVQSLKLAREHASLSQRWNVPVMLGHSRKPFLRPYFSLPEDREVESCALVTALPRLPKFLRIHTVGLHQRSLITKSILEQGFSYA